MKRSVQFIVGLTLVLWAGWASGQSIEDQTPDALRPWIKWVRAANPHWNCARVDGKYECAWPGKLRLSVNSGGGSFTLHAVMYAEQDLPLPSEGVFNPSSVTVEKVGGGQLQVYLFRREDQLLVRLPTGEFIIKGRFAWDDVPPELPLPENYGIVEADADGKAFKRRDGALVLDQGAPIPASGQRVEVSSFRRVIDGSPLTLQTVLRLIVSGDTRSISFGKVLPDGSDVVQIQSGLPFQFTQQGELVVEASAGQHDLSITAHMLQPVAEIRFPKSDLDAWPGEEYVLWQPDARLRLVEYSGGSPTDAKLLKLPSGWQADTLYAIRPGEAVTLKTLRRGEELNEPNRISLNREFWVDFDRQGFTVEDTFRGTLNRDFRLNALSELALGRAQVNGEPALITKHPQTQMPGVELRQQSANLTAVSRLKQGAGFSAIGWDVNVERVDATVHLPPSWALLGVNGATLSYNSWISQWTLLDAFIVILIVIGVYHLVGLPAAALCFVGVLLSRQEFLAPSMLIVHLLLLMLWRLALKETTSFWFRLYQTLAAATFAVLVLQIMAFFKLQLSQFLYPQLPAGTRYRTVLQEMISAIDSNFMAWPLVLLSLALAFVAMGWIIRGKGILGRGLRVVGVLVLTVIYFSLMGGVLGSVLFFAARPAVYTGQEMLSDEVYQQEYDQFAERNMPSSSPVIPPQYTKKSRYSAAQTAMPSQARASGPALPSWQWRNAGFAVVGPVSPDHQVRLLLLSPSITRLLCAVRAFVFLALAALLFRALGFKVPRLERGLVAAVAFVLLLHPTAGYAEFPQPELLKELESRIEQRHCSTPPCASIKELNLEVAPNQLRMKLTVSSRGRAAVVLPGPLSVLVPTQISRGGAEVFAVRRTDGDFLQLQVEDGEAVYEVQAVADTDRPFSLVFPTKPIYAAVQAEGFATEGLSKSGLIGDSLRLSPRSTSSPSEKIADTSQVRLPAWFRIERSLLIGERVELQTKVTRAGFSYEPEVLSITPLGGENVTSGASQTGDGLIAVSFASGQQSVEFNSTAERAADFKLRALSQPRVSESWLVQCESFVACSFSGLTPSATIMEGAVRGWWQPFAGEELNIQSKLLEIPGGEYLTLDCFRHTLTWGVSRISGAIEACAIVTQQQPFSVTLPPGATFNGATVSGKNAAVQARDGKVELILNPGDSAVNILYDLPWSAAFKWNTPLVGVDKTAHNVSVVVRPSGLRWLLYTGGVFWGPSVYFWPKLVLVVLLCVLLARIGLLPMGALTAAVLGAGLTTMPMIVLFIPLVWLVALKLAVADAPLLKRFSKTVKISGLCVLGLISLGIIYEIVRIGLVFEPPMLIVGNQSNSSELKWFVDHAQQIPQPWIVSLPLWCWRVTALLWATWMVLAIGAWVKAMVRLVQRQES